MRLFVFNCLLLASVAVALPNGRSKRHLSFLTNLLPSPNPARSEIAIKATDVIETKPGYKMFRLPGYDDIMIKVTPRKTIGEEIVYPAVEPANLNAFGAVVGTKSKKNTLKAVKQVNNLLSTRILNGGENTIIRNAVAPMFPVLNAPDVVTKEIIETAPVVERRFTEVRPLEEKLEVELPMNPTYSYKLIDHNEPVMTYTGYTSPAMEVLETVKMRPELPMCIQQRVDETIMLGTDPVHLVPQLFPYQTPIVDIPYTGVEANSYVEQPLRGDIFFEGYGNIPQFGLQPQGLRPFKGYPNRHIVRPIKSQAINPRPIPLNSPNTARVGVSGSKDKVDSQTDKVHVYSVNGEKVDLSNVMGTVPGQYVQHLRHSQVPAKFSDKVAQPTKAVQIVRSKVNNSNVKVASPAVKSPNNRNPVPVPKGTNALRTNVKTNKIHHTVAPTANTVTAKKDAAPTKIPLYTNKVVKPQTVARPVIVSTTKAPEVNKLRENAPIFRNNPIVVAEAKEAKGYSYQQQHADGSSINVKGNNHGVTVDVKESNHNGRGDIPDQ